MGKKPRLGTDPLKEPLDWIKDSREEKKQRKQSLQSKQRVQSKSMEGLPQGWTRATFIIREDHLGKLKDLAYQNRKQIKEVIDEALDSYLRGKRITVKRGEG